MKTVERSIAVLAVSLASMAFAADWPQFRGPSRDGIAPDSPALVDSWPKEGPKLIWQSTSLPSQSGSGTRSGGCSSVAVAGGKAFVYVSWKHDTPIPQRKFTTAALTGLGWAADVPDDLAAKIEAARLADKRAGLKGQELTDYVKQFTEANITSPAGSSSSAPAAISPATRKLVNHANDRIQAGTRAIAWADLTKLAAIRDKEFATPEEFDKALADMQLPAETAKRVRDVVPTVTFTFADTFVCLDAATGTELWKKEFPGLGYDYAASSTPTVAGDRVYIAGSNGKVYCLAAKDGAVIWEGSVKASPKTRVSSSFLILDKAAILLGGELTAYNADDGKVLWSQKKVQATENSAVAWQHDGKKYLICNTQSNVYCVEPEKGDILWQAPGGLYSTATVSGDWMVIYSNTGLAAYKLSPEKAEEAWSKKDWKDRGASTVIYQDHVYVVGGRIACVELAGGAVKWEAKAGGEICSPVLVDGKIICALDNGDSTVFFRATPEKYELLGKSRLKQAICTSPAIVDGKMYLRLDQAVGCFDLRKAE